jgi:hypothetical protein
MSTPYLTMKEPRTIFNHHHRINSINQLHPQSPPVPRPMVYVESLQPDATPAKENSNLDPKPRFLTEFYHVLQFCFLSERENIASALHTIDKSKDAFQCFSTLQSIVNKPTQTSAQRPSSKYSSSDSDDTLLYLMLYNQGSIKIGFDLDFIYS